MWRQSLRAGRQVAGFGGGAVLLVALTAVLVLLTGVGGMTSFGQAAFCGFGAYASAVLTTQYGWNPWATLPVSLAVSGATEVPCSSR